MEWRSGGVDGGLFRADALARPGWYWVLRPRNEGERRYDAQVGILLPVLVRGDERVVSPLADLRDLSPSSLTCLDEDTGHRYGTFYVGPVAPGALVGRLRHSPGQGFEGYVPDQAGWVWVRTRAPLQHVDADGVGPIFLRSERGGPLYAYAAERTDGKAADVWELGFAEPLLSPGGIIDASGEVERREAEFFGAIPCPKVKAPAFPVLR